MTQIKAIHEAMHGAGHWDTTAKPMEQYLGRDWFSLVHGRNGMTGTVPDGVFEAGMGPAGARLTVGSNCLCERHEV